MEVIKNLNKSFCNVATKPNFEGKINKKDFEKKGNENSFEKPLFQENKFKRTNLVKTLKKNSKEISHLNQLMEHQAERKTFKKGLKFPLGLKISDQSDNIQINEDLNQEFHEKIEEGPIEFQTVFISIFVL